MEERADFRRAPLTPDAIIRGSLLFEYQ